MSVFRVVRSSRSAPAPSPAFLFAPYSTLADLKVCVSPSVARFLPDNAFIDGKAGAAWGLDVPQLPLR